MSLGAGGGNQEGTPLVWNNTLYGITTWSVVYALDARTGKELWRWDPEVNQPAVRPRICCGIVNRGLALYNGVLFAPAIDGRLIALDALNGKPVWEARVAFPQDLYTITMAPRIANGRVIVGVSGGDKPTRGFFDAYDAKTGRRLWRFYTVPGDPSKPYENEAMRAAAKTWGGEFYKNGGGGAVWDGVAYDPETNLVYVGTGNAEPWSQKFRGAQHVDNLYTCSILAVDLTTGQLKWHYQTVPNDNWDFDSVQQLMLLNLTIKGKQRKVITQAAKDGFFYVLDRATGEFISATPFVKVSWATGFDERGRPMVNPEAYYDSDDGVEIFPTGGGAHNWSPMSWNPANRPCLYSRVLRTISILGDRGTETREQRLSAAFGRRAPSENLIRTHRSRRHQWRTAGVGPRQPEAGLAGGWWRRHRRRHRDHGRQPGVSSHERRHFPRI